MNVVERTYHPVAEDLRPCPQCGEVSLPFPHAWSHLCSWCWFRLEWRPERRDS
jgi:hypothetical protein